MYYSCKTIAQKVVLRIIPLAIQYDKKAPATQDHYGKWYGTRRTCRNASAGPVNFLYSLPNVSSWWKLGLCHVGTPMINLQVYAPVSGLTLTKIYIFRF